MSRNNGNTNDSDSLISETLPLATVSLSTSSASSISRSRSNMTCTRTSNHSNTMSATSSSSSSKSSLLSSLSSVRWRPSSRWFSFTTSSHPFIFYIVFGIIFLSLSNPTLAQKSDVCEYDLDLVHNTIKIVCEGSPSMVNVFAQTASLQADEYNEMIKGAEHASGKHVTGEHKGSSSMPENPYTDPGRPEAMTKPPSGHGPRPRPHSKPGGESSSNPGQGQHNQGQGHSDNLQKDRVEMLSYYKAGSFSDVVMNATQKLEMAKRSLSIYADSIRNISTQLAEGDLDLRADMEKLRRTSNSATDLKEGIIAAMSSQYNFMRTAILTRNYELERLVASLNLLVDVTADGLHSALMAHKLAMDQVSHVNVTLLTVRKMVSNELKKREGKRGGKDRGKKKGRKARIKEQCPKTISAIGSGTYTSVEWQTGAYMVESVNPSAFRSVYIMQGSGPTDQLQSFDAAVDVDYNLVGRFYALPFFCSGTGHAVYRRHFYCHKADTNMIVKYHLKRMDMVSEVVLPGAGYGNTYPYSSGENTDIDIAVDEHGIWAIYATENSAGKIVITKIDHQNMEVEKTWMTSYPKKHIGNAFMICGVMYATNSHKDTPTFIRYSYDTATNKGQVLQPAELPFANSALVGLMDHGGEMARKEKSANSVMLNYDFRTSTLYSWNNGRIEKFPVYFRETEE